VPPETPTRARRAPPRSPGSGELWARCLRLAIRRLWHACITLEIDPPTLNVDYVALYAATMLSKSEVDNLADS
jgi:hypothetical protein